MALLSAKIGPAHQELKSFLGESEGYVVALMSVFLCTLARYPLQGILETRAPYAFYLPVVAFVAWRYGLKASIACFSMGAALGTYLYVRPITMITNRPEAISLTIFVCCSLAVALIGEANRRAHDQLELAREELKKVNHELERRVEERTAALVEKNEELNSFTYTVAHDLRSAIRSMVVNARVLQEDEAERLGASGREQTQRLYSSAMRLSTFVDDLLQYARTGNRPIHNQRVNLSDSFERQVASVWSIDGTEEFDVVIAPDLQVQGDPTLIGLALHNLIENASKYRDAERPLLVELGQETILGETCYFVRDNGIGFEASFAEKIFLPFERLHRYAEIPGTGIGLSNVKRIIERHGGRIWAQASQGKGATFYFTLAAAVPDSELYGSRTAVIAA